MGYSTDGIDVIRHESYINARVIKIITTGQRQIEISIELANNGLAPLLSSHNKTTEGYKMFLQPDADGGLVCQKILDALLLLPYSSVVVEMINC